MFAEKLLQINQLFFETSLSYATIGMNQSKVDWGNSSLFTGA
jgi:hypothetical protein